jgi:hypothetical protein
MTLVYYNTENVAVEEMLVAKSFDTAEWELAAETDDAAILLRFRNELLGLMQQLADFVKDGWHSVEADAKLKREIKRYWRLTAGMELHGGL